MNIAALLPESLNNTLQGLLIELEHLLNAAVRLAVLGQSEVAAATRNIRSPIEFTPLQWTLLKVLLLLLLSTLGLIAYSWRVFGKVITEKFVRPSTLKEIEELKLSVAKLKLPKEHSPRI